MQLRNGILLACLVLLAFASVSSGQSPNGTVSGLIVDPTGAIIIGADILIANDATGVQYSAKTNGDGLYLLSNLPPGTYRLQVSKVGFKTLIKPDIILNVQDALAINFTLPVGAASETVTVEAGAPLVNTTSAAVGTVIDRNFVESLPLNGRSFNTLLQLTPGVVIFPVASVSGGFGTAPGQFSISGQRTDANNLTVDGVSANFGVSTAIPEQSGTGTVQAFSAFGGTSSLVSVEDLQEFRVEASSFAPEFGSAPGGQISLTTRSGTNDFHGGVYEYFRNDAMDANDWFADEAGIPKAPERHNDFGGYFGGPIARDRTFFFLSYEGARLRLPQTTDIQVPTDALRQSAPADLQPFLNAYPAPTGPLSANGDTAQFTGAYSNRATLDALSVRLDHTFNSRFSLFGRYNYAPSEIVGRPLDGLSIQTTPVDTQTLTIGVNMVLSSDVVNTLRGNYSEQSASTVYSMNSFGGAVPLDPSLIFGSGSLNNGQNYGAFIPFDAAEILLGPQVRNRTRQFDFVDDFSIATGTHIVKIGAAYRAIVLRSADAQYGVFLATPTFTSFVTSSTAAFLSTTDQRPTQLLSQGFSLYAQDTWKASPRLTLTYGLRWDLSPAPAAQNGTMLAAWNSVSDPEATNLAAPGTSPWSSTYDNIAPRLGIAYRLTKRGDFVLRGGVGSFYDTGLGAVAGLAAQFPNFAETAYANVPVPVSGLASYLPALTSAPPYPYGVEGVDRNLKLPRSYEWNVALEKSFVGNQVVTATYVGQAGRDLLRREALSNPNANFLGPFQLTGNGARSNYNSLQLQYRKPLSNRLQVLLNYTWSHSLDNASSDVVEAVSSQVISAQNDYASSDFDVRQSFSGAMTFDFPAAGRSGALNALTRGWSLATVAVARTGFPYNGYIGTFTIAGAQPRPDLNPGAPLYLSGTQCAQTFQGLGVLAPGQECPGGKGLNPAAFSVPPAGKQGTEGRNDIPGFGFTQLDLSLGRKFDLTDRLHLQFRADAFNCLNHPNFANPGAVYIPLAPSYLISSSMLNQGLGGLNPLFQEGGPRSLQLSLKLAF
ncbi:MAG: TonB-dependent receptor [Candidatus Acidiferrales bacterium]